MVGGKVDCLFGAESRVKLGFVPFPFIWILSLDLALRNIDKSMERISIKWEGKTLLEWDYGHDPSVLYKIVSEMKKL